MQKTSHNIQFRRAVRDCPANTREREKAAEQKRKPRLIIDWDVVINGEHRATFVSNVYRQGFVLRDLLNNEVQWRSRGHSFGTITKDYFKAVIEAALPKIPTVAAADAERARLAAEKAEKEAAERQEEIDRARRLRLNGAAEKMLDALKLARDVTLEAMKYVQPGSLQTDLAVAHQSARDVIMLAEEGGPS